MNSESPRSLSRKSKGGKIAFRLSENWTPWRVPWSRSRAPPRVRQKRAHGAVPPWHYTSLRRCTQASPSGRSWVETGGFLMSSPSRPTRARRMFPRLGRRSSCPLLRLTGYPSQQRDGTYPGGLPTPQVCPLLTISARAGGAYDVGRSSKNLHATRGNSAAAFLTRC